MWTFNLAYNSGSSSRMSGKRELFYDLDESDYHKIKLGDDKEVVMVGKSSVVITIKGGRIKLIHNVQYVPSLAHNLLSVGHLLANGYNVAFEGDKYRIKDATTSVCMLSRICGLCWKAIKLQIVKLV